MAGDQNGEADYQLQFATFERLRVRVREVLRQYGRPDSLHALGDFAAHADFRQSRQVKVSIGKLELLQPPVVYQLQEILKDFPGWEIVAAVAVDGHFYDWPDMGLYIRQNEIIDTLQRRYFPKEFQVLAYDGSRRMTEEQFRKNELRI